jgi:hypothetical protein
MGPPIVHSEYAAPATMAMKPAMAATTTSPPERPEAFIEAPARISTPAAPEKATRMANVARSDRITL